MNNPVRIGLIGLGKMGRNHLRVLSMLRDADLRFIYDTDRATLEALAEEFGVTAAASVDELLDSVDAAVLATPTLTHYDYIRRIGAKVKHIFVEKPLVDTCDRSAEILELVQEQGLRVQVGFIERFNPATLALGDLIGGTQRVINVDFTRTSRISERITDVDVVLDLMIHDLDLALHMNGPVERLYAHGSIDNGMIAFASAILTHVGGVFSRVTASRITEKKTRLIQATCSDMFIDCDLLRKEIFISKQSRCRHLGNAYRVESIEETVPVPPQEALLSELLTFIAVCRGEDRPYPDAAAGHRAMELCSEIRCQILGE